MRHGEIKPLDMAPMKMAFDVADPDMLEGLKPGEKVHFHLEKTPADQFVATATAVQR